MSCLSTLSTAAIGRPGYSHASSTISHPACPYGRVRLHSPTPSHAQRRTVVRQSCWHRPPCRLVRTRWCVPETRLLGLAVARTVGGHTSEPNWHWRDASQSLGISNPALLFLLADQSRLTDRS